MPFYHRLGSIPHKRHTRFRKPDGGLYHEEVMGVRGFSGIQTILYHLHPPTAVRTSTILREESVEIAAHTPLEHRHIVTKSFTTTGDPISSRRWLLANGDLKLGLSTPTKPMSYFYRNGTEDELLFIHEGSGILRTQFGNLKFSRGDYIVIPVGTTYQLDFSTQAKVLTIESHGRIEIPKRYRNEYGQLLEHSPYCERDIRVPDELNTVDERGSFEVIVKHEKIFSKLVLAHHPFDVVGWDGYLYPWIFNIGDFEPITGRIHQPPPTHQTFYSDGFVVCSFVPRMYDYHPEAIPVPYNHSNVNSDEVLYYVEGNFMSRRGIDVGSFTHHPAGLPHGPHPGTVEASLGQTRTEELAVMVDTFRPLELTTEALSLCDRNYVRSWLEEPR